MSQTSYNKWYRREILHLVDCGECGSPLEVMAIDSANHKIIRPCNVCLSDWRYKKSLESSEQNSICDECGGPLTVDEEDKSKRCKKCGETYV